MIVVGTLGVLTEAADRGLIDFSDTIARLRQASFYVSPDVLNSLLQRYAKKR
jgi:predicted nucleic acid-binding protein